MDDFDPYIHAILTPEERGQARRERMMYVAQTFKDDELDTMVRRLEAFENFIVNGVNEIVD